MGGWRMEGGTYISPLCQRLIFKSDIGGIQPHMSNKSRHVHPQKRTKERCSLTNQNGNFHFCIQKLFHQCSFFQPSSPQISRIWTPSFLAVWPWLSLDVSNMTEIPRHDAGSSFLSYVSQCKKIKLKRKNINILTSRKMWFSSEQDFKG